MKVVMVNKSEVVYDSLVVHVFPNKKITFFDVKPHDTLTHVFKYRNFSYPRGEHGAATAAAYKDDYYFSTNTGLIDIPFAHLEDEYTFYVWDNGVNTSSGNKPVGDFAIKHKISDIQKPVAWKSGGKYY